MSDGIVPPLFCRPAAADQASDGNSQQPLFSEEINLPHVVCRL